MFGVLNLIQETKVWPWSQHRLSWVLDKLLRGEKKSKLLRILITLSSYRIIGLDDALKKIIGSSLGI